MPASLGKSSEGVNSEKVKKVKKVKKVNRPAYPV
jgi:hypothetical protein